MLENQIQALKEAIAQNYNLSTEQKNKLAQLSNELEIELQKVETTEAKQIADHAHDIAKEPTNAKHHASLQDAVREFEVSHPNLMKVIQEICAQFGV